MLEGKDNEKVRADNLVSWYVPVCKRKGRLSARLEDQRNDVVV